MIYQAGWGLAHQAMLDTIKDKEFSSLRFSEDQLDIIEEVFSDYLMYIWMSFGDTKCNKEGYTTASVKINDFFERRRR